MRSPGARPSLRFVHLLALCLAYLACDDFPPGRALMKRGKASPSGKLDLRIINGTVVDGSGGPRRRADVGVRGDTIAEIGNLAGHSSRHTIDAAGKIVAPGFIDLLGQSEGSVLIDPRLEGKVRQGVTTEITGEGRSPGPLSDEAIEEISRTRPEGYPEVTWRTLGEYMSFLERRKPAINFAFFVGATNAREIVLGRTNRQPDENQLRRMEAVIEQAMQEGAVGLSSALVYVPAVYAGTAELVRLARVAGKYGSRYFTHIRSESDQIEAAMDEAFRIGREAGVGVEIFHLKIGGKHNWGRMPQIVSRIEAERAGGLDVSADVYPYTATSTGLSALAPNWALEGGYDAFRARLRDAKLRRRIADEMRDSRFYARVGGANGILIRRILHENFTRYERTRLDEIARLMETDPVEAALRLFEASEGTPTAIYFSLSEEDVKVALKQPWTAIGSDSGAVVGVLRNSGAHPRAYGTFPRILGKYVREEKLLTLEEAVRKMTSLPASRVNITDRGLLQTGMKADLVVFDEQQITDRSTYEDPHQFSVGISNLVVNGIEVLRDGRMTGELPGRVLRRQSQAGVPHRKP